MQKLRAARESEPRSDASGHLDALDGLRFLAAFCILFHHACGWIGSFNNSNLFSRFGEVLATYGMTLFFVLSGFVIHYNYGRLFVTKRWRWAALEFAGARIARLYPLYLRNL